VLGAEASEYLMDAVRKGGFYKGKLLGSREAAENFWADWSALLPKAAQGQLRSLDDLAAADLSSVMDAVYKGKDAKGGEEDAARYGVAWVDGKAQPIRPFGVDRPGVFVGVTRYKAMTGRLRPRITSREVTLNIGAGERAPKGPWKEVIHNPYVDWIASWRDPLTGLLKYARFAPKSSLEGESAEARFDLAREASLAIPRIARRSVALMTRPGEANRRSRHVGACLWLIGVMGMRIGAGVVAESAMAFGASTLLARHVSLARGGKGIRFEFPGKDGVPYVRTVREPASLVEVLADASSRRGAGMGRKRADDILLDALPSKKLRGEWDTIFPGKRVTSKVLRTSHASMIYDREVKSLLGGGVSLKDALYIANVKVALFCNHRRKAKESSQPEKQENTEKKHEQDLAKAEAMLAAYKPDVAKIREHIVKPYGLLLSTSQTSYIDPRITVSACKRANAPIERCVADSWASKTPASFSWVPTGASKSGIKASR
jgi:DNA topoisomerase-1